MWKKSIFSILDLVSVLVLSSYHVQCYGYLADTMQNAVIQHVSYLKLHITEPLWSLDT